MSSSAPVRSAALTKVAVRKLAIDRGDGAPATWRSLDRRRREASGPQDRRSRPSPDERKWRRLLTWFPSPGSSHPAPAVPTSTVAASSMWAAGARGCSPRPVVAPLGVEPLGRHHFEYETRRRLRRR